MEIQNCGLFSFWAAAKLGIIDFFNVFGNFRISPDTEPVNQYLEWPQKRKFIPAELDSVAKP